MPTPKRRVCYLCGSGVENNLQLGEFKSYKHISVHYYCLLVTSGLPQNGDDEDGILGFLPIDIEAEVTRIKRLKCTFCKKNRANIGCCAVRCRRVFHTNCAITEGCLLEFVDPYKSYCPDHIKKVMKKKRHSMGEMCTICHDVMGKYHPVSSILSPCCNSHWFHKTCLQEFALSAGYYFKCPMCNNTKHFREAVKLRGVYVPDKDADWELEPDAFAELLDDSESCGAETCLCSDGREHESRNNELIKCHMCGSNSIHSKCWKSPHLSHYTCPDCVLPVAMGNEDNRIEECDVDVVTINECNTMNGSDECPVQPLCKEQDVSSVKSVTPNITSVTTLVDENKSMESNESIVPNVSAMGSSLSDVEIIEHIVEPVLISSDEENSPLPQVQLGRKRTLEVSPKNHRSPSKKIRRTLATMKNQSKITAYFTIKTPIEAPDNKQGLLTKDENDKAPTNGNTNASNNNIVFKCETDK